MLPWQCHKYTDFNNNCKGNGCCVTVAASVVHRCLSTLVQVTFCCVALMIVKAFVIHPKAISHDLIVSIIKMSGSFSFKIVPRCTRGPDRLIELWCLAWNWWKNINNSLIMVNIMLILHIADLVFWQTQVRRICMCIQPISKTWEQCHVCNTGTK